jgi:hypothetical protein
VRLPLAGIEIEIMVASVPQDAPAGIAPTG